MTKTAKKRTAARSAASSNSRPKSSKARQKGNHVAAVRSSTKQSAAIEMLRSPSGATRRRRDLSPGTLLTREWSGQHHRVTVLDQGFVWEGRTYSSLSEIAKAITGTKWNGPRFFGLRDKKHAEVTP